MEFLITGLATAVLALIVLLCAVVTAALHLVGVGLLLTGAVLRLVRAVSSRERVRLSRPGRELGDPSQLPPGVRDALRDLVVRRELLWLLIHATFGLLVGLVGLTVPLAIVQHATYPLWFWIAPGAVGPPTVVYWSVHTLPEALLVASLGLVWVVLFLLCEPVLARLQDIPGRFLLSTPGRQDLSARVAQLTASRAAALDAHTAELRRIERALHDGVQNRLVAANLLLGAAVRAAERDGADSSALLGRAQAATESALTELRSVVREVLPPVLTDRGLVGALSGLAAASPVPCRLEVHVPTRCPAGVEATAYFTIAEALTNVARHSSATQTDIRVDLRGDRLTVQVSDDGVGGAAEGPHSGLGGIRRRVEAHDGDLVVDSPPGGPTVLTAVIQCGS